MSRFKPCYETMALYVIMALLIGISIAKILGFLSLEGIFTQIITILQILAALVLAWIAGWKRGD